MKKVLVLWMLLSAVFCAGAAHFEHSGGMLWSQVGGWAEDGDEPRQSNTMSRFDVSSVHSYAYSAVSAANCGQDGYFSAAAVGTWLTVSGSVQADGDVTAIDGAENSYAGFSPTQPGVTNGIYFTLVADEGENDGDLATIELSFSASGSCNGSVGGGMGGSDVMVAVNLPLPAPEIIDPQYIAYSHPRMTAGTLSFSEEETAVFKVKIGHTVAIFLGGDTVVNLGPGLEMGSIESHADAEIAMNITEVNPYTGACEECDLDGSGKVDMADFAIFAAAWLTDAYPFPPPPPPAPDPGTACSTAYNLWVDSTDSGYLNPGQSIWYKVTPEADACYTIDLCNSDFDTAIELYKDCGGYIQGFDDDGCSPQSKLEAELSAWQTVYLRIRGKTTADYGDYEITVSQGCTGGGTVGSDDCSQATQIYADQPVLDDTTGATGVDETQYCGSFSDTRDLWYRFVAPDRGYYDFLVEYSGSFDGTLATYAVCDYESIYHCAEAEEGSAYISEWLMENESLIIRVASYEGSEGDYELTVSGPFLPTASPQ